MTADLTTPATPPNPDPLEPLRMIVWIMLGVGLYYGSIAVGPEHQQLQVALWKIAHVTTLAFVGYWISRQALGRVRKTCERRPIAAALRLVARAVLIGLVVLAGSTGL
jgi:hypothetical protein